MDKSTEALQRREECINFASNVFSTSLPKVLRLAEDTYLPTEDLVGIAYMSGISITLEVLVTLGMLELSAEKASIMKNFLYSDAD